GSGQGWRPGEDRSAGCHQAGALPSVWGSDCGVGSGPGLGSAARSGTVTGIGQAGPVTSAPSSEQVSVAYRATSRAWGQGVDPALHGVGRTTSLCAAGAGGHSA